MIRSFFLTLIAVPVLSFSAQAFNLTAPRDSVGTERKAGKLFVRHKVEPKETLYALSRKYSVPVAQIVEANPSVQTSINIGQIVLIPRGAAPASTSAATKSAPAASNRTYTVSQVGYKMHTVEPQQTLYAISRMYNVSVDDIKGWNGLTDTSIEIGQKLIVGKGVAQATQKPVYVPEPDDEIATTPTASVNDAPTNVSSPAPAAATPAAKATDRVEEEETTAKGLNKMSESGMAEMIDAKSNDTNKYLALHKSAPVGTIMQVKNMMNGQVVYVRVIGKLPDTGANDKVVVRLSKKAYQKLGAVDERFRVELSYMP
ncbi:septal ring lytic transglycosylase RlpA family protein [Pontibacter oryzae]|uniref:LysM peptidoglycan-binding domain-containing protein n=1 Tax=Pontibacter oryzae TaxID=2304593 RepID=A0A399RV98_9BACT|nr:LysM peptidoglycan-binding domain-containing protein [Pontibacter oryzae]RIJ34243.1 LysM peptidoglycan-binding domain-containing protein [Pontibacter oryzae]